MLRIFVFWDQAEDAPRSNALRTQLGRMGVVMRKAFVEKDQTILWIHNRVGGQLLFGNWTLRTPRFRNLVDRLPVS